MTTSVPKLECRNHVLLLLNKTIIIMLLPFLFMFTTILTVSAFHRMKQKHDRKSLLRMSTKDDLKSFMIKKLFEEKDDKMLSAYIEAEKEKEKEKEEKKYLQKLIDEKDKRLGLLEKILVKEETARLRDKGLLTSRGIMEFYLRQSFEELKEKGIFPPKSKFNASATLEKLQEKKIGESIGWRTDFLVQTIHDCKFSKPYTDIYGILSDEIHGFSWSGDSVLVYESNMPETLACIIKECCKNIGLSTTKQDEKEEQE
jgi:hypothetical protein